MTEPTPELTDECWPVTIPSAQQEKWDKANEAEQQYASALAVWTLRLLTLDRVGGCPVTVRPCVIRQRPPTWQSYPVDGGARRAVYAIAGVAEDCGCESACGCSPSRLHTVELPPPVGRVDAVKIDGVLLDEDAYWLDRGRLVRTDGQAWPSSQNMGLPDTESGTWSVTYLNAAVVDGLGALAAGVLAVQWLDGLSRGECKLPTRAIAVARQGTSMQLKSAVDSSMFPNGRTGVDIADAYIERFNPDHAKHRSAVVSPDLLPVARVV